MITVGYIRAKLRWTHVATWTAVSLNKEERSSRCECFRHWIGKDKLQIQILVRGVIFSSSYGARIAQLVQRWTLDQKFMGSIPGRRFFSTANFLCQLLFGVFHPKVTAVARKRWQPFCQKCRWQATAKHAHTLDPAKSERSMLSRRSVETYQRNELTSSSSGNKYPKSSQLTEPWWTDPGLNRGIGVRQLTSTWKINK